MLKRMLTERAGVWEQMKALRDLENDLTAEQRAIWDTLEARLTQLTADIERIQRMDALEAEHDRVDRSGVPTPRSGGDPPQDGEADYRTAFEAYCRYGNGRLTGEQLRTLAEGRVDLRAQGIATGAAGGYLVPQAFRNALVETMKYFSNMRSVAEVVTTDTGATLPWPTNNDTANVGAILAENSQVTQQDVTIGQAQLAAYMYTSKLVLVSLQLIQDSAINVDEFLPRKLGERIGRIQNQHFTTGTGTAQPLGIQTNATAVTAPTGNTVLIPYDTLIDVIQGVDPAYRQGGACKWMVSDTALGTIRKLKDTTNRPLWEPSLQAGVADSLLGYPVVVNNDLPVPAANVKSILFGDFRAAYVIRDVTGVQTLRLDERYADYLQVGFLSFQRSDATVQDSSAYRAFAHSAT